VLALAVVNVFLIFEGNNLAALAVNALVAALVLMGMIGTRFWPDKIRFREPGE
jgi:hypothetical protein